MPLDVLHVGVLFLGFLLGLVSVGFIDARVSARHPQEKERLGAPFDFSTGLVDALSHESQWAGFILLGHFMRRDFLLSALCLANVGLWVAVVTLLFGFWSPRALAV